MAQGGNLRNGSNAGFAYVNDRNTLGNANWNILARISSKLNLLCHISHLKRVARLWAPQKYHRKVGELVELFEDSYVKKHMKRVCKNVDITDLDFIENAIRLCLKEKHKRKDVNDLLKRYGNEKRLAVSLQQEIMSSNINYPPIWYSIKEDKNSGKIRKIGIQDIKQQIYDYIAVLGLKELFDAKIGYYQCASIKGKGQIFGKRSIERWVREKDSTYCAKGDIKKCYESINVSKMKSLLSKYVKNDILLNLVFKLIDSFDEGLSIGSYLSQFLCNFYLSFAYHFASQKLYKEKRGKRVRMIRHVLFYMDDFVIIGSRLADVKSAMRKLIKYLKEFLHLEVKSNWQLFKIGQHHIDMMGYKIYKNRTEIRRKIFFKMRRVFKKVKRLIETHRYIAENVARRCISFYGYLKHTDSFRFCKKYKVYRTIKACRKVVSNESKIRNKTK